MRFLKLVDTRAVEFHAQVKERTNHTKLKRTEKYVIHKMRRMC